MNLLASVAIDVVLVDGIIYETPAVEARVEELHDVGVVVAARVAGGAPALFFAVRRSLGLGSVCVSEGADGVAAMT